MHVYSHGYALTTLFQRLQARLQFSNQDNPMGVGLSYNASTLSMHLAWSLLDLSKPLLIMMKLVKSSFVGRVIWMDSEKEGGMACGVTNACPQLPHVESQLGLG